MKEILVNTWCDACVHTEAEHKEPGQTTAPLADGSLTLDLCERHDKELLAPLRELLAEYGAKAEPAPRVKRAYHRNRNALERASDASWEEYAGRVKCPIGGCPQRGKPGSLHLKAFSQHLRSQHDRMTLTAYREQYGEPRTYDGRLVDYDGVHGEPQITEAAS